MPGSVTCHETVPSCPGCRAKAFAAGVPELDEEGFVMEGCVCRCPRVLQKALGEL